MPRRTTSYCDSRPFLSTQNCRARPPQYFHFQGYTPVYSLTQWQFFLNLFLNYHSCRSSRWQWFYRDSVYLLKLKFPNSNYLCRGFKWKGKDICLSLCLFSHWIWPDFEKCMRRKQNSFYLLHRVQMLEVKPGKGSDPNAHKILPATYAAL